ncbi:hypothetical protein SDC9_155856 [bioreactor metagenome]|uniref:Uncharacterized protein n=1 Tax=bioreactor metagenome TaxID=1076179 RepID=A0A645F7V6_9ZZZZ
MQPAMVLPDKVRFSVSNPASSSTLAHSARTCMVLPCARGLPLNKMTFISYPPYTTSLFYNLAAMLRQIKGEIKIANPSIVVTLSVISTCPDKAA